MFSLTIEKALESPLLAAFADSTLSDKAKAQLLADHLSGLGATASPPSSRARTKAAIKQLPPVRAALRRRYARAFAQAVNCNLFHGVHKTFAEATAHCPPTKPVGYDQPGPASLYRDHLNQIFAMDLPALAWLKAITASGARGVFDFGGHVGVAYYAFGAVLKLAPDFRWVVYDVPAVRGAGEKLATARGATGITFVGTTSAASGLDAFYAAGSAQYSEKPLAALIGELAAKPRHVVVNKLPVTDHPTRATIQNIGVAFCPYWITNRASFVSSLDELGYELVDGWRTPELHCEIPYERGYGDIRYEGYYFRLTNS